MTSTPLLDVSIPDVKMDRYSVMFGNLLQSTSDRSSSLLVRRQVNAEKVKPLKELISKVIMSSNGMVSECLLTVFQGGRKDRSSE